eukprot:14960458-Alexandrium_andersonii.AAC.1
MTFSCAWPKSITTPRAVNAGAKGTDLSGLANIRQPSSSMSAFTAAVALATMSGGSTWGKSP